MPPDYCEAPKPPADGALREVLLSELHEAEERCARADHDRELYGRVADACQAALSQLSRNEPQQSDPCVPSQNYR